MTAPFSFAETLQRRFTLIEASAGTGKTYTLAGLYVLALAEGKATASECCFATFTEAATAELRGRLREQIVQSLRALRENSFAADDEIQQRLSQLPADTTIRLLETALRDFDETSITTIHGFCSRVVSSIAGGSEGISLTSLNDDIEEVATDHYIRLLEQGPVSFSYARFLAGVKTQLSLPSAILDVPDEELLNGDESALARRNQMLEVEGYINQCCTDVIHRRIVRRRRTFDDLLVITLEQLHEKNVVNELRRRFRYVFLDEFQDTDQVQWDIFRTAFLAPLSDQSAPVVVAVGDPKQSIYRFRSAELSAYLTAKNFALAADEKLAQVVSLTTNYRSSAPLITGLNKLFAGFTFGSDNVAYEPVVAAPDHQQSRLQGVGAPLQLRVPPAERKKADDIREFIHHDIVVTVAEVLANGELERDGKSRKVQPSDIAILANSNDVCRQISENLSAAGIPAVASSSDSVLKSKAAEQWKLFLEALDRPTHSATVRRGSLTWFGTQTPHSLLALKDDLLLFDQFRMWSRLLQSAGLPQVLAELRAEGLSLRVLQLPMGERHLTDVEHIAELLQTRSGGGPTTAAALLDIMSELEDDQSDANTKSELLDRRIDRDDDTVKVMTIHKAKGLEFPIVLCPLLWTGRNDDRENISHAWIDGKRRIDLDWVLGGTNKDPFNRVYTESVNEEHGERRRQLYVALTRAAERLIVWHAFPYTYGHGVALRQLLALGQKAPNLSAFTAYVADTPEIEVAVLPNELAKIPTFKPFNDPRGPLATADAPTIDTTWRRWSFSGMKRAAESDVFAPVVDGGFDESSSIIIGNQRAISHLPLRTAPAGAAFGNLVHSVFESIDFSLWPHNENELREQIFAAAQKQVQFRQLPLDINEFTNGLLTVLQAPLGGPLRETRLCDLNLNLRLNEMSFDLPLQKCSVKSVANTVLEHLDDNDEFAPWFKSATQIDVPVEGMLTGSIDLVARTATDASAKYWLADYKTNIISENAQFTEAEIVAEMIGDDYVLQTTLYQVALYRFLRWRLGAVDPSQLLGSAYLFVRGMDPSLSAAEARGVKWWRLPDNALFALDELFARGQS